MLALMAQLLAGWTLSSVLAGLALGMMIHSAEKLRTDRFLENCYASLAASKLTNRHP